MEESGICRRIMEECVGFVVESERYEGKIVVLESV